MNEALKRFRVEERIGGRTWPQRRYEKHAGVCIRGRACPLCGICENSARHFPFAGRTSICTRPDGPRYLLGQITSAPLLFAREMEVLFADLRGKKYRFSVAIAFLLRLCILTSRTCDACEPPIRIQSVEWNVDGDSVAGWFLVTSLFVLPRHRIECVLLLLEYLFEWLIIGKTSGIWMFYIRCISVNIFQISVTFCWENLLCLM